MLRAKQERHIVLQVSTDRSFLSLPFLGSCCTSSSPAAYQTDTQEEVLPPIRHAVCWCTLIKSLKTHGSKYVLVFRPVEAKHLVRVKRADLNI